MMGGGNMPSSRSVQRKMDKKSKLKKKLDSKNKE